MQKELKYFFHALFIFFRLKEMYSSTFLFESFKNCRIVAS